MNKIKKIKIIYKHLELIFFLLHKIQIAYIIVRKKKTFYHIG